MIDKDDKNEDAVLRTIVADDDPLVRRLIRDTLQRADPKDLPVRLALLSRRYAKTLGLSPEAVQKATLLARKKLIEMADAMETIAKSRQNTGPQP